MSFPSRPDIVVGIDVGQTCSGVAYSIGPDWCDPRILNRWPSCHGIENADKVATRVGYRQSSKSHQKDTVANWGFECVFGDEHITVREQFKLALDSEYEDDRGFDCEAARQWYSDYLICLHHEIERFFDGSVPRWREKHVEYSFSIPTTWKNPAMIASIGDLMRTAGFNDGGLQTVRMGLTEAEAAAIEAAPSYNIGDVFMICDAGGGTTDVNIMRVQSLEPKMVLEPLDHVEGESIGSTLIDFRMYQHILGRLEVIKDKLEGDIYSIVEEMLAGKFQTVKHSFPTPPVSSFRIEVGGLSGRQSFPEAGIEDSKMVIQRSTLAAIFDEQISKMFELIDERIEELAHTHPLDQLSYIILSGGLGSSPYLHQQLKRRYEQNLNFSSRNTAATRLMKVLEPQLAVVRGLVKERTQQLGNHPGEGQQIFRTRRCRNSYGVTIRLPYDETEHWGLPTMTGKDGNQWVEHVVDWFIRKGQEIDVTEGVKRSYLSSIATTDDRTRHARIVMSPLPADQLPIRMSNDGKARDVASVRYYLKDDDMKLKNRQFWKLKKKFWRAEFDFVVLPGPADLHFQVIGKNGLLNCDQDSLKVDYMDPSDGRKRQLTERVDSRDPMLEPAGGTQRRGTIRYG